MTSAARVIGMCCGLLAAVVTGEARAQHHGSHGAVNPPPPRAGKQPRGASAAGEGETSVGNVRETAAWPEPVADNMVFWFVLFELLEYQTSEDGGEATWDLVGWVGGDYNRFWFKTEGAQNVTSRRGEFDVQAVYGRLITPFFDFQAGLRYNQARHDEGDVPWRVSASIGLQGISPLRFELEPTIFISHKGEVSGRLTATRSILLTQRAVLQGRFETEAAVQEVKELGVGSGLNNITLGLRLRYDLWRELSPYIGVSWTRSLFETADLVRAADEPVGRVSFVAGLRVWL